MASSLTETDKVDGWRGKNPLWSKCGVQTAGDDGDGTSLAVACRTSLCAEPLSRGRTSDYRAERPKLRQLPVQIWSNGMDNREFRIHLP